MEILQSVRKLMLAGLGVPEKLKEVVEDLVSKGELNEAQARKLIQEWSEKAEKGAAEVGDTINEAVKRVLERMNLPTRQEVDALKKQLAELAERLGDGQDRG